MKETDGSMQERLVDHLESEGMTVRIVKAERSADLEARFTSLLERGLVDRRVSERYLSGIRYDLSESGFEPRSLISVAVADPQVRFRFGWKGGEITAVVPPTYLHWRKVDAGIRDALEEVLEPQGYSVAPAPLPKKLLAVCSGLAEYGRNNITYVDGMGSFHRLAALVSDLPCPEDGWREAVSMERCRNCTACLEICPTGAICSDRFVIKAERCLTLHNEEDSKVAFPDWIDSAVHTCLVGCMRCQYVCPENKDVSRHFREGECFSADETDLLIRGVPLVEMPAMTAEKLQRADLVDMMELIPRNLKALLPVLNDTTEE